MMAGALRPSLVAFGRMSSIAVRSGWPSESWSTPGSGMNTRSRTASA